MKARNVIVAQRVRPEKAEAARRLRHESTPAEALLWSRLRGNQVAGLHFRRQQVIDGFIVDLYCHQAGLIVEVDGSVHIGSADVDAERTQVLATRGLRVIRFANEQVLSDIETVVEAIRQACEA